ncbi:hypothetical protein HUU42_04500 [bacterium]|nr:hypothetical protein [bacterium]
MVDLKIAEYELSSDAITKLKNLIGAKIGRDIISDKLLEQFIIRNYHFRIKQSDVQSSDPKRIEVFDTHWHGPIMDIDI